jgi:hypothetical protein
MHLHYTNAATWSAGTCQRCCDVSGARFEIAIDGTPRTYRDRKELAIEAATFLKAKNPNVPVTVRDLETGEMIAVKHPLSK